MKYKSIIKTLATSLTIISLLSLTGCSGMSKELTEKEQTEYSQKITSMITDRVNSTDIEKDIDENILKLNEETASVVVNAYIYSLYQQNSDMVSVINSLQGKISTLLDSYKIDLEKGVTSEQIKQLPDGVVKGLLEEMSKNYLVLHKDGDAYYSNVDMNKVLSKYSEKISTGLYEVMSFRAMEDEKAIYSSQDNSFDIDEVAKRISTIEGKQDSWENTDYAEQWLASKQYYYSILFGVNHIFFFETEEDGTYPEIPKVKDEIIEKYKEIIKNNPETELAKDVSKYLEALNATGNLMDSSVTEFVVNLMNEKFTIKFSSDDKKEEIDVADLDGLTK